MVAGLIGQSGTEPVFASAEIWFSLGNAHVLILHFKMEEEIAQGVRMTLTSFFSLTGATTP